MAAKDSVMRLWKQALACVLAFTLAAPASLLAQVPPPPPTPFPPEQLEQIAAPIALYPDPLLAQVLMASTYPLEVVQAARFVQANPTLQGGPLNDVLRAQPWDDSVKSLALFPQVLAMMNDKLDWTQKLGDAFLGQQQELMDAVQRLRARAQAQGMLTTTPQQTVVVAPAPQPIIQIVPTNPEVIYVPVYNPTVVYGPWAYPAYPPYYYYPPAWPVAGAFFSFGVGIFAGAALWGVFDWHSHRVDIDVPRYHRFTEVVNVEARRGELERGRTAGVQGTRMTWEPNVQHRRGVGYRDAAIQQRFGQSRPPDAASRDSFRGRVEPGRAELAPAQPGRAAPAPAQQGRVEQGRAGQEQAQPGRIQAGRAQPGQAEQPRTPPEPIRPGVQASPRPEAGRGQPERAPRMESSVPPAAAPGQRREPGLFQGFGSAGGDVRAHSERGRESRQAIAPPAPAVRAAPPPVSAPSAGARAPSVAAPPSPPAHPSPPAAPRPQGGGGEKRR